MLYNEHKISMLKRKYVQLLSFQYKHVVQHSLQVTGAAKLNLFHTGGLQPSRRTMHKTSRFQKRTMLLLSSTAKHASVPLVMVTNNINHEREQQNSVENERLLRYSSPVTKAVN